jgi:hypothetical protein
MRRLLVLALLLIAVEADAQRSTIRLRTRGPVPNAAAAFQLPNDDNGCPENCRQIPWSAGSDQWNSGTLPTYEGVNCTTNITEGDGTTDNASAIQTCINNLSSNQAAVLAPGIYYVNGVITLASNKVLRGSGMSNCTQGDTTVGPAWSLSADFSGDTGVGAACTTLKFGASGRLHIQQSDPSRGSEIAINAPTKGDTTITCTTACTGISANDWISIFQSGDDALVLNNGCTWCGENSGDHVIQQYAQVTAVNGTTLTISRPVYYTYTAAQNPGIKETTFTVQRAGIEDLKVHGFADTGAPLINIRGLFAWVKNVETFNAGNASNAAHVQLRFAHGAEIRGSYFHQARASTSGRNYGIFMFAWNSDHKFEDNILRVNRHPIVFEGGGSGVAVLFNYIDDAASDDTTYNESLRTTHGPHPMFGLLEGNDVSRVEADDVFGSSSHFVYFRNWIRGEITDLADRPGTPDWGFWGIDIKGPSSYYSAVGNILGSTSWTSGITETTDATSCGNAQDSPDGPKVAYLIGCQDSGDWGTSFDTVRAATHYFHQNYDYVTDSVAINDGGANTTLETSMYYDSQPAFLSGCSWPAFGPGPTSSTIPAKARFTGGSCS